ncbi:unnamed protein product [Spirodela intermedia]|uniref:Uncharacterized protein n=2 Tax=Spirodela intermedia TaxID=51605 RepID=A0A7I8L1A0_SPIIN|nr:unnamed protein product [Spirodela intermedia]CAA6666287.1 unnamed protein product [Spirodela intermedia]CAA7403065.1 unnamed protein product [Spirodela intermedia]
MPTPASSSSRTSAAVDRRRRHRSRPYRWSGLGRRCLSMVKQQKTRFYILGRCIAMLLCWHAHALPD